MCEHTLVKRVNIHSYYTLCWALSFFLSPFNRYTSNVRTYTRQTCEHTLVLYTVLGSLFLSISIWCEHVFYTVLGTFDVYWWVGLPDPMHDLCPLPDCQISGNYFTYWSVQIFKILSGGLRDFKSDPPQKILRYWIYNSAWLICWFPPDQYDQAEMFCISLVPVPRRHISLYRRDWLLNIFAWFIRAGECLIEYGRMCAHWICAHSVRHTQLDVLGVPIWSVRFAPRRPWDVG